MGEAKEAMADLVKTIKKQGEAMKTLDEIRKRQANQIAEKNTMIKNQKKTMEAQAEELVRVKKKLEKVEKENAELYERSQFYLSSSFNLHAKIEAQEKEIEQLKTENQGFREYYVRILQGREDSKRDDVKLRL